MKLIARGAPDKVWPRQIVLDCCRSLVEVTPEDILLDRDYHGEANGPFLICPGCGSTPRTSERMRIEAANWRSLHPLPEKQPEESPA